MPQKQGEADIKAEFSDMSNGNLTFKLRNRDMMPAIGLGTYRMETREEVIDAVDHALASGYRLFDTAPVHNNELYLQEALRTLLPKYDLEREDIFITTKLPPTNHGFWNTVVEACNKSLKMLGQDYVDLYLIHFPGASELAPDCQSNRRMRDRTWTSLEQLEIHGYTRAIGVSNFTRLHLEQLMSYDTAFTMPHVNQVEFHPYYNQTELLNFCEERDIVVQAYSSFGGTSSGHHALLEDPVITRIAHKHEASCAQVLLLWALQKGVAVIPKSTNAARIKENISFNFLLTDEDMQEIDGLSHHNIKYGWDHSAVA